MTGDFVNQYQLEKLTRRGASSLAESLHFYWPSNGLNEIPEANQALHIGSAFLNAGFLAYAEAHRDGETHQRFDLLVVEPRESTLLVAEFKRVFSKTVGALATDAERILEFSPRASPRLARCKLELKSTWGLVGGTTWEPEYVKWFLDEDPTAKDPAGGELDALWKLVSHRDAVWGAHPLIAYRQDRPKKGIEVETQWFVFVLFKVKG
ncbi:hypothetical protein [Anaeromyxobacter sp. SG26]|uniref:hypothetical protein n=1 Tax=Anaeromyxobacter sp. SG26 TaxID=2925407 RepID=UPI001F58E13A|nr:hypothetical protein [Anaeromyxobacter sp. SG26]